MLLTAGFNYFQPFVFRWFFVIVECCFALLVLDCCGKKIISVILCHVWHYFRHDSTVESVSDWDSVHPAKMKFIPDHSLAGDTICFVAQSFPCCFEFLAIII